MRTFFPLFLLAGVMTFSLIFFGLLSFQKSSSEHFGAEVAAITQMSAQEMAGLSISELRDARRTLSVAQRHGDFPEGVIERELRELDAVLDQKMDEVIR